MQQEVYKIGTKWFYIDEETLEEVGPFDDELIATKAFDAAHKWFEKDHKNSILKMRDYYD